MTYVPITSSAFESDVNRRKEFYSYTSLVEDHIIEEPDAIVDTPAGLQCYLTNL